MSKERHDDAARKRKSRRKAREVVIPACADIARRLLLEGNDEQWLRHYFAELFSDPFTAQQLAMIDAIRTAIMVGGDQAIAASRGDGKTKIFERMLLKYTLQGVIKFSVLFAATGGAAQDSLQSIMGEIEDNDRLHPDYPEVCGPVRALENVPNRAHYQLVSGKRHDNDKPYHGIASRFSWCGQEIVLPKVPGSPSAAAIIATRGLDSSVRGLSKRNRRVDVAGIDDPDTLETISSQEQADKLERKIDRAIMGLGGQKRTVARVMLTTIQNRTCVSYKFTDPAQKPSWNGKRFRFLIKQPDRIDLWNEYTGLRKGDWRNGTALAQAFYAERRTAMDAGAEVANPNRYTPQQVSALQFYFDQVARTDAAAVATEYDNDPPEDIGPVESGINPRTIQKQVSGLPQGIVPPDCIALTQGIDVGKTRLHWVVRAWTKDGTGYTIDYGRHEVYDVKYGSDEGLDRALHAAILRRMEEFKAAGYATADGLRIADPLTLVDARWRTDAIYAACSEVGLGIMPVMGIGQSAGCIQANFRDVQTRTPDRTPGDGWFMQRKGNIWLVLADADRWKAWEHDRWMTSRDRPGCMFLFGEPSDNPDRMSTDEREHGPYAQHITAEVEVEEIYKGVIRRRWRAKSKENHWLDASYYADVAANIKGIRLLKPAAGAVPKKRPQPQEMIPQESISGEVPFLANYR